VPAYTLRDWGGPHSQCGSGGEEKNLAPTRARTPIIDTVDSHFTDLDVPIYSPLFCVTVVYLSL
jgi:hypothetical protein